MYGYKVFFTFRLKGKSDLRAYYKPVETHDSLTLSPLLLAFKFDFFYVK